MFQGILCGDSLTKAPPFGVTKWDDPPNETPFRWNHRAAVVLPSSQPVPGVHEKGGVIPPQKRWQGWFCVCGNHPGFDEIKIKGVQLFFFGGGS